MSVIPQWSYFSRNMSNPQSIFDDTFSGLEIFSSRIARLLRGQFLAPNLFSPSYFIAIFSLNTTCLYPTSLLLAKPSFSAEICSLSQSLETRLIKLRIQFKCLFHKTSGLPQLCVYSPPPPPSLFFKLFTAFCSCLHNLILIACACLNFLV